jgi:hypothetical protein
MHKPHVDITFLGDFFRVEMGFIMMGKILNKKVFFFKKGLQPLFSTLRLAQIDYKAVRETLLNKARGEPILYKLGCIVTISQRHRDANPRHRCHESLRL